MASFWLTLRQFIKEIILFGLDAFMVSAAREVARRFWVRLSERGGAIAALDDPRTSAPNKTVYVGSGGQSRLPFLDEYRD